MSDRGTRRTSSRFLARATLAAVLVCSLSGTATRAESPSTDLPVTIREIEACASQNLQSAAGVIEFSVEAIDRSGVATASRAEMRWRKDDDALTQVLLRVSEPAKTAGTALLVVDRERGEPDFFVRLPDLPRAKRVRSKRLRGPVLGTDFSFEDLGRLREPLDRTELELIGTREVEGRSAWVLETRPSARRGSEYSRVLTFVDQERCLPIRIDLFEGESEANERLRKRLTAPFEEIRTISGAELPHVFRMQDLRRETETIVRIERYEPREDWPASQFTKRGLEEAPAPASIKR